MSLVNGNPAEDELSTAVAANDDVTAEQLDASHVEDNLEEGFRLEKREETEETSRTEELVERPDGSEVEAYKFI